MLKTLKIARMIAGIAAQYAREGVHVTLICATKGEAGEISDASLRLKETECWLLTIDIMAKFNEK